ncbi:protein phosphatase 1D [Sarcoptes scabiei]|nr:protein phosphatase 1D [Sarcoptes scabiei]
MRLKSSVYDFIDENDPVCFDDKNHSGRHYRMRISMSTHQGGRKYMEDEYSIVHYQAPQPCEDRNKSDLSLKKSFMFFGVFDGHGGDMAARFSRKHLCRNIVRQKMFWSDNDDEVCLAIHKGFLRTQKEMLKELGSWPKTTYGLPSTAGTTASIIFLMNGKYYTGHVGDSRIVLGRRMKDSNSYWALPLTQDHKPDSPEELQRIQSAGGQVANKSGVNRVVWNRPRPPSPKLYNGPDFDDSTPKYDSIPFLAISRSLGDLWSLNRNLNKFIVSPEPDVNMIPIDPDDCCLILASDGLWNMVNSKTAMDIVQNFEMEESLSDDRSSTILQEPQNSHSKKILDLCMNRWTKAKYRADNVTIMVVMIDQKSSDYIDQINEFDFESNGYQKPRASVIGRTIHSFNFDRNLTDENFIEAIQPDDDSDTSDNNENDDENILEEVKNMLNEIILQCDRDAQCENKIQEYNLHQIDISSFDNKLMKIENEFICDKILSYINFTTLSSKTFSSPQKSSINHLHHNINFRLNFIDFDDIRFNWARNRKLSTASSSSSSSFSSNEYFDHRSHKADDFGSDVENNFCESNYEDDPLVVANHRIDATNYSYQNDQQICITDQSLIKNFVNSSSSITLKSKKRKGDTFTISTLLQTNITENDVEIEMDDLGQNDAKRSKHDHLNNHHHSHQQTKSSVLQKMTTWYSSLNNWN